MLTGLVFLGNYLDVAGTGSVRDEWQQAFAKTFVFMDEVYGNLDRYSKVTDKFAGELKQPGFAGAFASGADPNQIEWELGLLVEDIDIHKLNKEVQSIYTFVNPPERLSLEIDPNEIKFGGFKNGAESYLRQLLQMTPSP